MQREIIKFLTAGNVDDGKSTMIGRLLYDNGSLYEDQIAEVKAQTEKGFVDELDFSLFLDGLTSERKQKITIDVAYRYFFYLDHKFIIADAPGHEQYIRNMAVAVANSDIAVILIDAKKKVQPQTIVHSNIINLFGIKNIIVAVNKMDLFDYSQNILDEIKEDYLQKISNLNFKNITFVPISAIYGDNILQKSSRMAWYKGQALIDNLLYYQVEKQIDNKNLRFSVQNIIKHEDKRLYQGFVADGQIEVGDEIIAFPSRQTAKVAEIFNRAHPSDSAFYGDSIAITTDREIDLERGAVITKRDHNLRISNKFNSKIIWFGLDDFDLSQKKEIYIKINHDYVTAVINKIFDSESEIIKTNQIAKVELELSKIVAFDNFAQNKLTGSFLLIDKNTNETLAAGIIEDDSAPKKSRNIFSTFFNKLK